MTPYESLEDSLGPDCPSNDELEGMLEGTLADHHVGEIENHIEGCPTCQNRLGRLDAAKSQQEHGGPQAAIHPAHANENWDPVAIKLVERLRSDSVKSELREDTDPSSDANLSLPVIEGFKLVGLLGRGGMGAVYDAIQVSLERPVAIKVLPDAARSKPETISRFDREMAAIGQLDHPGIVRAIDASESNGLHYLVMERVEGCTTAAAVQANGPLAIADACEIVRQTAIALQYIHQAGLIHRDLKPSNLMINGGGVVKILDLGLARLGESTALMNHDLTSTGQIMGTVDFMSPEQASGDANVSTATDIYSLGATLYFLLTGSPPFHQDDCKSVLQKLQTLVQQYPPALSTRRPTVPESLEAIVSKMMEKRTHDSPSARPAATATRVSAVRARRCHEPGRSPAWRRRRPYVWRPSPGHAVGQADQGRQDPQEQSNRQIDSALTPRAQEEP